MIKVYSKPKCVQCEMTKEFLKQNNVKFEEVNVFEEEEALELIQLYGFKRLPVITRNNNFDFAFSGFQIDLLDELVEK